MEVIKLRDEYIKLGQALKAAGLVETGAKIKAEVGPVDILVNNAGLMKRVPMIEMSHADFMRANAFLGGCEDKREATMERPSKLKHKS